MRRLRLLVAGLFVAGALFAGAAPAAAVCPQSHGGGCDPCEPTGSPELPAPVGGLGLASPSWLFDNCIQ